MTIVRLITSSQISGAAMEKRGPKVATNTVGYKCINVLVQKAIGRVKILAKMRDRNKKLNGENPELNRKRVLTWRTKNPDKVNANNRKWARDNAESVHDKQVKYKSENRELVRDRERTKYREDLVFQTKVKLRKRFSLWVGKAKGERTFTLVGLTVEDFTNHLCAQGRYETGTHIDHIFPLVMYNIMDTEQQRKGMNYTNTQPLTARENLEKGAKLPTKAMAAKVAQWAWPEGVTVDMLPDKYPGWATGLRKYL